MPLYVKPFFHNRLKVSGYVLQDEDDTVLNIKGEAVDTNAAYRKEQPLWFFLHKQAAFNARIEVCRVFRRKGIDI